MVRKVLFQPSILFPSNVCVSSFIFEKKFSLKYHLFKEDLTYLWLKLLPARIFYASFLLYFSLLQVSLSVDLSSLQCMLHENRDFPLCSSPLFSVPRNASGVQWYSINILLKNEWISQSIYRPRRVIETQWTLSMHTLGAWSRNFQPQNYV